MNKPKDSKTHRKNPFNNKSFNQVLSIELRDPDCTDLSKQKILPVDKRILWEIEKNLDEGSLLLSKEFDIPVMVEFIGDDFLKLPKNVLTQYNINTQGNSHNASISKAKRSNKFFYYPDGKFYKNMSYNDYRRPLYRKEIELQIKEGKKFDDKFHCVFCNESFKTEGAYLSHKESKKHFDSVKKKLSNDDSDGVNDENIFDETFIRVKVLPNKDNYYSSSEFRKETYPGCKHCIYYSSICSTIGYGNKSSRKTKGRNKREKFMKEY
mgnify:CR=1 FL=1